MLDCVEIAPSEPQRGSVIWMHGLGASGHDFEPIVPLLGLPGVRFVFPHALRQPVTINAGFVMPSWYDIKSLDGSDREEQQDIRKSAVLIEELIAREIERGVAAQDIVLAGFSQGGAMAMYVGARYPARLAGIMALSCYLLIPEELAAEAHDANAGTPMLFCHGVHDPMVPYERGRAAFDAFTQQNAERSLEWHDFEMGHEVCPPEIQVIRTWLHGRFD